MMKNKKIFNYFDNNKSIFKNKPISKNNFQNIPDKNNYNKQQTLDSFLLKKIKRPLLNDLNNITNNQQNFDEKYVEIANLNDENKNNTLLFKYDNITMVHNKDYNSNKNTNLFSSITNDNTKTNIKFNKKFIAKKRKKYDEYNKSKSSYNHTKYNNAHILKKIKKLNNIILSKNTRISELKRKLEDSEAKVNLLSKQLEKSNDEIIKCRFDISKMLKEISKFTKDRKTKFIIEQDYYYGINKNIVSENEFNKMKYTDSSFTDGIEINTIKEKLKTNEYYTEDLNNNNDLLSKFKLELLGKEKKELNEYLKQLIIQKDITLYHINLYEKEKACTFSPYKKDGLPYLSDQYQIIELIGTGGYSEVYKAYDVIQHKFVACKLVQINNKWNEKIKDSYIKHTFRENIILKKLDNAHIVKLLDTIEINNFSFGNILEYCKGPNLRLYIAKNGPVKEKIAKAIIYQILQALLYLYQLPKKIIHYDLKPENIIFNEDMTIKITDFGLSKIIDENSDNIRLTSQGVGTYCYLPPECFLKDKNNKINTKVDIWSLGVITYEIIFNTKPFAQEYNSQKFFIMNNANLKAYSFDFPDTPKISEDCKAFIKNCLKYKSEERYDVVQALNSDFIKNLINK